MSPTNKLGEEILAAQTRIGLENPTHYRHGLSGNELLARVPFNEIPAESELNELYSWRDGVSAERVSLSKLWIKPGYYMLRADEMAFDNRYGTTYLDDWSPWWYPILTDGSGGRCFIDTKVRSADMMPVFYYQPDLVPASGQIYDSIELMLRTIMECYNEGIYTAPAGVLKADFPREVRISQRLNPKASFWKRNDLF